MTAPQAHFRQAKLLDAGDLQPEIRSFRLHLAAEGKAVTTVRTYSEAADGDGMGPTIVVTVGAGRSASTRPATIFADEIANEARRDGGDGAGR